MKTINWLKEKNWQGKKFYEAEIVDEQGQRYDASIWPDVAGFENLMPGHQVEGELVKNAKGYWTLKGPKPSFSGTGFSGGRGIAQAQERKAQYIEKAQERKNESVSYFNSLNSAIALLGKVHDSPVDTDDTSIKHFITRWRDWFLTEWKAYEAKGYEDKHSI